jgi:hypothetical protein
MPSFRAPKPVEPSTTVDSDGAVVAVAGDVVGGNAGGTAGGTARVGRIGCPGIGSVGPSGGTLDVAGTGVPTLVVGRELGVAVPVEGLEQAALAPASATATAAAMETRRTRTADTSEPSPTRIPSWCRRQQDRIDGHRQASSGGYVVRRLPRTT